MFKNLVSPAPGEEKFDNLVNLGSNARINLGVLLHTKAVRPDTVHPFNRPERPILMDIAGWQETTESLHLSNGYCIGFLLTDKSTMVPDDDVVFFRVNGSEGVEELLRNAFNYPEDLGYSSLLEAASADGKLFLPSKEGVYLPVVIPPLNSEVWSENDSKFQYTNVLK